MDIMYNYCTCGKRHTGRRKGRCNGKYTLSAKRLSRSKKRIQRRKEKAMLKKLEQERNLQVLCQEQVECTPTLNIDSSMCTDETLVTIENGELNMTEIPLEVEIVENFEINNSNVSSVNVCDISSNTALKNEVEKNTMRLLPEDCYLDAERIEAVRIEGRRIVDINHIFEQATREYNEHARPLDCQWQDFIIVGSRRKGLKTEINMQCRMCHYRTTISSEPKDGNVVDVNKGIVAATIKVGIGYSQMEKLLGGINIPCMAQATYAKIRNHGSKNFITAASEKIGTAGEEERRLAIERGDIADGIPHIPVMTDRSWMKKSYINGNFDSAPEMVAIIGYHTKQILFISVKNKYCSICEISARNASPARGHKCLKNSKHQQSSPIIKTDVIVEGFKWSIEMHGLIYSTLIGDEDNSIYAKILDSNVYLQLSVRKIVYTNHLLKYFCTKIKEITSLKACVGRWQRVIETSTMKMWDAVQNAVQCRSKENVPTSKKAELLKEDVRNIASHVFWKHENCTKLSLVCYSSVENEENDDIAQLKLLGLYNKLEKILNDLSCKAESLLYNINSNCVDSCNSILCRFLGEK